MNSEQLKNEQLTAMNNQILNMGVRVITERTPEYQSLCGLVQRAIDAKGGIIYNGNKETEEVPFYCNILQVFYAFDPEDDEYLGCDFPGWHDFANVTVVYFDKIAESQREAILRKYFDQDTVDLWLVYRDKFDNADTIAIRTTLNDGQWFETIMNYSKK